MLLMENVALEENRTAVAFGSGSKMPQIYRDDADQLQPPFRDITAFKSLGNLRDRGSVISFLANQHGAVVAAYHGDRLSQHFQHGYWLHGCPSAGIGPPR